MTSSHINELTKWLREAEYSNYLLNESDIMSSACRLCIKKKQENQKLKLGKHPDSDTLDIFIS